MPEGQGSSPYVTSVGGTQPASGWPAPGGETAVDLSPGSCSNYWDMSDWQKDAVATYLTQSGLTDQSQRQYNIPFSHTGKYNKVFNVLLKRLWLWWI